VDLARQRAWRECLEQLTSSERLDARHAIQPIMMNGIEAPLLASPIFLKPAVKRTLCENASALVDAAVALEFSPDFHRGMALYDRLYESLSECGRQLINQNVRPVSRIEAQRRFRRLDGFVGTDGTVQFIEINQSAPLAISFYERARAYYNHLTGSDAEANQTSLYRQLAAWLLDASPVPNPTIAVSVERGYPAKFVDLPAAARGIEAAARAMGRTLTCIVAEPTEFRYGNGNWTVHGHHIDMLWRNTVYLDSYNTPDITDYAALRRSTNVPMVNDLQTWLLRSKEFLAMIWDDSLIDDFRRLGVNTMKLRVCVPFSCSLSNIPPACDKNQYILKRCDDGFGKGIVFGADITDAEWRRRLGGSCGSDWIVQKLVQPMSMKLPVIDDAGAIIDTEMVVDINPYMVCGETGALLVRAQPTTNSGTMNIVNGAAIGFAM